jgi:hypothetical protein
MWHTINYLGDDYKEDIIDHFKDDYKEDICANTLEISYPYPI